MEDGAAYFRSETIPAARELLKQMPSTRNEFSLLRIPVIVDANVVLQGIRWMLTKRKSPGAVPELLEVLEAETLQAYAPTFMEAEILSVLPDFSAIHGMDESEANALWVRYRSRIQFLDVGGPDAGAPGQRDPKDAPYLRLQAQLQIAIHSKDKDIPAMGGALIHQGLLITLRAYSREAAIALNLRVMGILSVALPVTLAVEFVKFVHGPVAGALKKVPQWFWMTSAIAIGLLMIFPHTRNWLSERWSWLMERIKAIAASIMDISMPFYEMHQSATTKLMELVEEIATQTNPSTSSFKGLI